MLAVTLVSLLLTACNTHDEKKLTAETAMDDVVAQQNQQPANKQVPAAVTMHC